MGRNRLATAALDFFVGWQRRDTVWIAITSATTAEAASVRKTAMTGMTGKTVYFHDAVF